MEETGATEFDIKPICVYSVKGKTKVNENEGDDLSIDSTKTDCRSTEERAFIIIRLSDT